MEERSGAPWFVLAAAGVVWLGIIAWVVASSGWSFPTGDRAQLREVVGVATAGWISMLVTAGVWVAAFGTPPDQGATAPLARLGQMTLASIALTVAVLLPFPIVLGLSATGLFGIVLLAAYLIFLLWFGARTILYIPYAVLEGHRAIDAITASYHATKGRAFGIVVALLAIGLLTSILERIWMATDTETFLAFLVHHGIAGAAFAWMALYFFDPEAPTAAPATMAPPSRQTPMSMPGILPTASTTVMDSKRDGALPARLSEDLNAGGGLLFRIRSPDDVELLEHVPSDARMVAIVDDIRDGLAEECLMRGAALVACPGLDESALDEQGFDPEMFGRFEGDRITLFQGGHYERVGGDWLLRDVDVDEPSG